MKTRELTRVAIYTALTCSVAVIFRYVPATYVPYSILPLMVLLAGFVLGPRLGALSMSLYALLGLVGVPVFSSGGGIAYVLKPSFGYILGYILAAYAVGKVLSLKKEPGVLLSSIAVLTGLACLYAVGLSYFYLILNFYLNKPTIVYKVIQLGFIPFIALDLVKAAGAVVLGRSLGKALNNARA